MNQQALPFFSFKQKLKGTVLWFEHNRFVASSSDVCPKGVEILDQELKISAGTVLKEPLHFLCFQNQTNKEESLKPFVIRLGQGAKATLTQTLAGPGLGSWAWQIHLDKYAQLYSEEIHFEGGGTFQNTNVFVAGEACYKRSCVSFGQNLSQIHLNVDLQNPMAETKLYTLAVLNQNRVFSHTSNTTHLMPQTFALEHYKSVVDDAAKSLFSGTLNLKRNAVQSIAKQLSQSLLLSPEASAKAKPELRILADDVKAAHGATVGQLDADALFYLQSRGISKADAKRLLLKGFAQEIVNNFENEAFKEILQAHLNEHLSKEAV